MEEKKKVSAFSAYAAAILGVLFVFGFVRLIFLGLFDLDRFYGRPLVFFLTAVASLPFIKIIEEIKPERKPVTFFRWLVISIGIGLLALASEYYFPR